MCKLLRRSASVPRVAVNILATAARCGESRQSDNGSSDDMIAHLRGTLIEKHPNQVIVEAAGVGYDVQIPISTYTSLPDLGASVALRIYTHVREDMLSLYGFATADEKLVFERLISVSGIGPKLANTVLSGLATSNLIGAIRSSDVQQLVRIPGVGKKTAERIVLELKDKLPGMEAEQKMAAGTGGSFSALERDVLSALQNLGCSTASAEVAVRKTKERGVEESFEPFFRAALAMVR
jgi:holliday junction DNA helicase RuvA